MIYFNFVDVRVGCFGGEGRKKEILPNNMCYCLLVVPLTIK